jgi:hypothetical protein
LSLPFFIVNVLFCNCKKGCNAKCCCKKVGLFCSLACTSCQGQSCSNVQSPLGEDAYDICEKISDSSLLEQFTCIQQEDEEEEEEEDEKEGGKEEDEEDSTLEVPSDNYQSDE